MSDSATNDHRSNDTDVVRSDDGFGNSQDDFDDSSSQSGSESGVPPLRPRTYLSGSANTQSGKSSTTPRRQKRRSSPTNTQSGKSSTTSKRQKRKSSIYPDQNPYGAQWANNFVPPPGEARPYGVHIDFANSHEHGSNCQNCSNPFHPNELIVCDYEYNEDASWCHLGCWQASNPSIKKVFKKRTHTNIGRLRFIAREQDSTQPLFHGWDKLKCYHRQQFLAKVFSQNTESFVITASHINQCIPCREESCAICQEPQFCSYKSCCAPDVPPEQCIECNQKTVHFICQHSYEQSKSKAHRNERVCQTCLLNPSNANNTGVQTRSRTRGTTRSTAAYIPPRPTVQSTVSVNHSSECTLCFVFTVLILF